MKGFALKAFEPHERDIQKACLDYLRFRGVYAWRNNTFAGNITQKNGSKRFLRAGKKGSADILGVADDGRFLAIEVKSKSGVVTEEQRQFLEDVRARHGVAMVVRSPEELAQKLEEEGVI